MLLDARTRSVANRIDDVLAALPARAGRARVGRDARVRPRAQDRAARDGRRRRGRARRAAAGARRRPARQLGLCAAAAGTHPLADPLAGRRHGRRRHQRDRARRWARWRTASRRWRCTSTSRYPTAPTAVRALDGLRDDLPLLLALSANSPFWRGVDSGFASMRSPIFSMFPRVGIPRRFGSYAALRRRRSSGCSRSAAIPDPSFLWWDARLRPRLGTVEVRIMDAQSRVGRRRRARRARAVPGAHGTPTAGGRRADARRCSPRTASWRRATAWTRVFIDGRTVAALGVRRARGAARGLPGRTPPRSAACASWPTSRRSPPIPGTHRQRRMAAGRASTAWSPHSPRSSLTPVARSPSDAAGPRGERRRSAGGASGLAEEEEDRADATADVVGLRADRAWRTPS